MPMAYKKNPTQQSGKLCANVDSKPHIHEGRPRLWLQIYKEIITAQIFKQKIWHMTTLERMSVILLEYIDSISNKKPALRRAAQLSGGILSKFVLATSQESPQLTSTHRKYTKKLLLLKYLSRKYGT